MKILKKLLIKIKNATGSYPASFLVLVFVLFIICNTSSYSSGSERESLFPKETELLLSINLGKFDNYSFPAELIKKLNNFYALNTYFNELQKMIDFNISKDFLSWLKGSVYVGIIRTGKTSPVAELLARTQNTGNITFCKINLYELSDKINRYNLETGRYPENLEELALFLKEDIPVCPSGGTYSYTISENMKHYSVTCSEGQHFEEDSLSLYQLSYDSEKGLEIVEKSFPENGLRPYPLTNIIAIIPIKNFEGARSFMERIITRFKQKDNVSFSESSYDGFNLYTPSDSIKAGFALNKNYFLICDNPEVLKASIDTLNKKRSSILQNSRYLSYLRNIPENSTVCIFCDTARILESDSPSISRNLKLIVFLKSCESIGMWTNIKKKKISGDFILTFTPGEITREMERIIKDRKNNELKNLLYIFPHNISNYASFQIFDMMSLFNFIPFPYGKKDPSSFATELLTKETGLSWEQDIKPSITGQIGISYELGELLADSLLSQFLIDKSSRNLNDCCKNLSNIGIAVDIYISDHHQKLPFSLETLVPDYFKSIPTCPAGGSYIYELTGNKSYVLKCHRNAHKDLGITGENPYYSSSSGIQGYHPEIPKVSNIKPSIPFLIGFEINNISKGNKFIEKLSHNYKGFSICEYKDRKIYVAKDGGSAYIYIGNFLFFESGGHVPNKIEKVIDTLINTQNSLYYSKSFKEYQNNVEGTTLLIKHDRIEWISSILKGFLLLAGSDFANWAETVGEFKDLWSTASIFDRKIKITFEISGD